MPRFGIRAGVPASALAATAAALAIAIAFGFVNAPFGAAPSRVSAEDAAAPAPDPDPADNGVSGDRVAFRKTVIDNAFRAEGVAVADVNRDGRLDVLVGDYWYEAPDWTRHEIRPPGDYGDGQRSYSEAMCVWAEDVNKDGWVDQIAIGFPGNPCYWYENPKGADGHWTRHVAWPSACNETPLFVDLFGTGERVLVMGFQPEGKEREGQMAWFSPGSDPAALWTMRPVSEPSAPGREIPGTFRFAHGLGVGDVNADGRLDVICTGGWWEQPPEGPDADRPWPFHPYDFAISCADMHVEDVNGDGLPDILATSAHQFGIWVFEQRPDAPDDASRFVRRDLFPMMVSETHAVHHVDINGDGVRDFVTGKRFWSHGRSEPGSDLPARLFWFQGERTVNNKIVYTPRIIDEDSGVGTQFWMGDLNADGLVDIAVANKKGVFLFEQTRRD